MTRKYNNSPIVEAVCEFQFDQSSSWDLTIPGLIYEKVQKTFPKRNQIAQINFGIAVNTEAIGHQVGTQPLMQFLQDDGNALIQVGPNLLTINQLAPYSSWQEFLPLIEQGIQAYKEAVSPQAVQRVALRYLNRLEFEHNIRLEDYLNFYPFLGKELPQEFGAFVLGVQIPCERLRDMLNLQLTSINSQTSNALSMILDIAYILSQPEKVMLDEILVWINTAHKRIEETFEACITDQLRQKFKEVKG